MQHQDCRIVAVLAPDCDPLFNAANPNVSVLINPMRSVDGHRVGDLVPA
jgi:hypothetical protein